MRTKIIALLGAAGILLSLTTAQAASHGMYVGVGVGDTEARRVSAPLAAWYNTVAISDEDRGNKVFVGWSARDQKNLVGFELGYADLGTFSWDLSNPQYFWHDASLRGEGEASSVYLSFLTGKYLTTNVAAFFSGGLNYLTYELMTSGSDIEPSTVSDSTVGWLIGVGLDYRINKRLSARLGYEKYERELSGKKQPADFYMTYLNFAVHF